MSRARSVADLGNQNVLDLNANDGTLKVGAGVTIENTGEVQFAGIVTAATVQIGAATTLHSTGLDLGAGTLTCHNITSTGVLTYEDVTSVDSIGIITAQSGVNVTGGDVKIGTTNNVTFGSRRALTVANGTTGAVISLYNNTTATANPRISSNPGGSEINDIGIHAASTNGNIIAYTNNDTERLRIDASGNVTLGYAGNSLYFQNGFNNRASRIQNGGGSGSADLKFFTNDAGTEAEKLRITSAGKVGINQVTPTAFMHVKSGANDGTVISTFEGATNNKLDVKFISTGPAINVTAGDPLVFEMSGTERLRIIGSGNVGIGTNVLSASSKLTLFEESGNGQTLEIKAKNSGGAGSQPGIKFTANNGDNIGGVYGDVNSDTLKIQTGGSDRLSINSAGNVTIGVKKDPAWHSSVDALTVGYAGCLYEDSYSDGGVAGRNNYVSMGNNIYYGTSGGNKYINNDEASRIMMHAGDFYFQNASGGTAESTITFNTRLKITSGGSVVTGGNPGNNGSNENVGLYQQFAGREEALSSAAYQKIFHCGHTFNGTIGIYATSGPNLNGGGVMKQYRVMIVYGSWVVTEVAGRSYGNTAGNLSNLEVRYNNTGYNIEARVTWSSGSDPYFSWFADGQASGMFAI
jgi:hypothetical protein